MHQIRRDLGIKGGETVLVVASCKADCFFKRPADAGYQARLNQNLVGIERKLMRNRPISPLKLQRLRTEYQRLLAKTSAIPLGAE